MATTYTSRTIERDDATGYYTLVCTRYWGQNKIHVHQYHCNQPPWRIGNYVTTVRTETHYTLPLTAANKDMAGNEWYKDFAPNAGRFRVYPDE